MYDQHRAGMINTEQSNMYDQHRAGTTTYMINTEQEQHV